MIASEIARASHEMWPLPRDDDIVIRLSGEKYTRVTQFALPLGSTAISSFFLGNLFASVTELQRKRTKAPYCKK